jgi:hypothetical protein
MRPELILVIPIVIGLITLFYLHEEKIRDFLKMPQRDPQPEVKEHATDLGTFRTLYGGTWSMALDGKDWEAKDRDGEPDPSFVERIPDIRRVLHLWERKVREEEDGLEEYVLSNVEQGDADDEVELTFTHREHEHELILFVTIRAGEIVETSWMD